MQVLPNDPFAVMLQNTMTTMASPLSHKLARIYQPSAQHAGVWFEAMARYVHFQPSHALPALRSVSDFGLVC